MPSGKFSSSRRVFLGHLRTRADTTAMAPSSIISNASRIMTRTDTGVLSAGISRHAYMHVADTKETLVPARR